MSHFIVGLTGGIGSGKSTVADLFVQSGASLVDTDAIAHELTGPDGDAMPALIAGFGTEIARPDGALDRIAMRQKVFADPAARKQLENILHPLIRQRAAERCLAATTPYVILAVPLLLESGNYRERCDRILVVDCPESLQIERVMQRSALSADEAAAILKSQATREARLAIADDVISNAGARDSLLPVIVQLHQKYLRLAAEKPQANC